MSKVKYFTNYLMQNKEIVWVIQISAIIFCALILSFLAGRFISYLERKNSDQYNLWREIFLRAVKKPLKALIWILAIVVAVNFTADKINIKLTHSVILLKDLGIIFCISWFMWGMVDHYEELVIRKKIDNKIDITTYTALIKLLKLIILVIAALMALQSMGISINGVLAFGGIGGIAIGFAARDLLANFFGALMIFMDRPFSVGDVIKSPDRQIEGVVDYISWRLTHVRTADEKILYIPNSIFSTIIIENHSRMTNNNST